MGQKVAKSAKKSKPGTRKVLKVKAKPAARRATSASPEFLSEPLPPRSRTAGYAYSAYSTTVDIATPKEGLTVWVSDVHHGYADYRALDVVLKYLQHAKPHTLVVGGDYYDAYSISSHDKEPARAMDTLQTEFDAGRPFLEEACKHARNVVFIQGNHEQRLERHIFEMSGLHGLHALDFASLAEMPSKIVCYPFLTKLRQGRLYWHHGQIASANTARATYTKFGVDMVCGHAHRADMHVHGDTLTGETKTVLISGHLCDVKKARYADYPSWSLGFASAQQWTERDGLQSFSLRHHLLQNYSVGIDGKVFRG